MIIQYNNNNNDIHQQLMPIITVCCHNNQSNFHPLVCHNIIMIYQRMEIELIRVEMLGKIRMS